MRSFRHRRGRIAFEIFGAFLLASLAAERWIDGQSISGLVATIGLTAYCLWRSLMLFVRDPALGYGEKGIQVGRLFKLSHYQWAEVRDIRDSVWTRPYIPFMHWLPKERHYLEIQTQSETIKVRPDMMELPPDGAKQLIDGLRRAQIEALGERGAAMARLGARTADRSRAPVTGVQAERLQRLGIGADAPDGATAGEPALAPPRQISASPYPAFGRKGA